MLVCVVSKSCLGLSGGGEWFMVGFYARKKNKEGIGTAGALVIVCSWGEDTCDAIK